GEHEAGPGRDPGRDVRPPLAGRDGPRPADPAGVPRRARRDDDRAGRRRPARAQPARGRGSLMGKAGESVDVPVALLGYGTVGAAVNRLLTEQAHDIERATGHRLRVVKALVRDAGKEREYPPPA